MQKSKNVEKECKKHGLTDYVLESSGYYRCKKCRSEATQRRREKIKQKLVEYFGGECITCHYSTYIGNLDFHHLDPNQKDFGISSKGLTKSFIKILEEALKCILVCNRCHGEIHAGLRDPANAISKLPDHLKPGIADVSSYQPKQIKSDINCPGCGGKKYAYAQLCKKCSLQKRPSKIAWPSKEELQKMVKEHGFSKTGRLLGVSDNAVRKRFKK